MLHRSRFRYWSHSWVSVLIGKLLGAPPRPKWGTMEEWAAYNKNRRKNFPLLEITENILHKLQNIYMFPSDVYHSIRIYIRNRFIDKLHVLDTGLKKGAYASYDYRLLHGIFNSFVQFIENEQTLKNLKWEITLVNEFEWLPREEALIHPDYGKPCPQAIAGQEKLALYTWWKEIRPARVDGYELSGFAKWSKENKDEDDDIFSLCCDDGNETKTEARKALSARWREIDEAYDKEDEEMMIRLIKLRHSLWT